MPLEPSWALLFEHDFCAPSVLQVSGQCITLHSWLLIETAVPLRRTLYELVLGPYSLPVLRPCTDHVSFSSLPAIPVRFSDVGYAYQVKFGSGRETEEDG